jgi:hypothetical protein
MVASAGAGSMLHLFLGLKSLVKVSRFHTDGSVFRLHYRLTVMVLLAFTFIVTTRQYIGSPIMCVHTKEIPKEVLNTYCWIHPTYTLSSAHWKRVGVDVPHPGVDKTRDERDKKHVKYYQWVGFCLFFQVRTSHHMVFFWFLDSHEEQTRFYRNSCTIFPITVLYMCISLFRTSTGTFNHSEYVWVPYFYCFCEFCLSFEKNQYC